MAGRTPTLKHHDLANLIEELLHSPGVIEVSRTQVSAFLWYNVSSSDIAMALHILHRSNRARMRKVAGINGKRPVEL